MKIKALLLAAAVFVAGASAANAQEAVVTNSFGSNMFVGVQGGLDFASNNRQIFQNPHGAGLGLGIYFGKWITPSFAVRANLNGLKVGLNGWDNWQNNARKFLSLGGDFVWDVCNFFGGYKQRTLSFQPYINASVIKIGRDKSNPLGATVGAGFMLPIRLGEHFAIVPDFRLEAFNEQSFRGTGDNGNMLLGFALIGLQYDFGKRTDWDTAEAYVAPYTLAVAEAAAAAAAAKQAQEETEAAKAEAQKANEELKAENETLKEELDNKAAINEAIVKNLMSTPAVVYFEIGQTTLSVKELAHLDYIVKTFVAQGKDMTFTVVGNTDKNTGTVGRNKQIAKQRANYIVNLLTTKYGLNKDQFEVVNNGGKHIFDAIELDRAVIIEAK